MSDAYTFYVVIGGVPESIFWDADIWFVYETASNICAYNSWINNEKERALNRSNRLRKGV